MSAATSSWHETRAQCVDLINRRIATLTSTVNLFWDSSLDALDPFLVDLVTLSATSGSQGYGPGVTLNFGPFNVSGSQSDDLAAILLVLQAGRGGSFAVRCSSLSPFGVIGGGGDIRTTHSASAGCGASIEYTYNAAPAAAPEPTSLALVGLALFGGVGACSRRRKAA